jgi:hypothetical protein
MKNRSTILIGMALAAFVGACGPAPEDAKGPRAADAVDIVLRVTKDDAQILAAAATRPLRQDRLRSPAVTAKTWMGFAPLTEELVAEFLTQDGVPVASYGFSDRALTFEGCTVRGDEEHEPDRALPAAHLPHAKGPVHDDRFFSLPVPKDAAALAFYRTSVRPGVADRRVMDLGAGQFLGALSAEMTEFGPAHVTRTLLSFNVLDPFTVGDVFICPPWPPPPDPERRLIPEKVMIEVDRIRKLETIPLDKYNLCAKTPECGNGKIEGHETIWPEGVTTEPATRFDVVVVGDGFAAGEESLYQDAAKAFAERLRELEPFASHTDKIAIHRIDVVSDESGPSWPDAPKKTYFGVLGEGTNSAYEMPCPCELMQAGRQIASLFDIELYVLIGNSDDKGAKAKPELRLAMFARRTSHDTAFEFARHEIGHAVSGLWEEVISPGAWACRDQLRALCNVTTQERVDDGSVWWQVLADPSELDGNDFKAKHALGADTEGDCGEKPVFLNDPALVKNVGVFWGAGFLDIDVPSDLSLEPNSAGDPPEWCRPDPLSWNQCSWYNDSRGAKFYRPMATCIMRFREDKKYCKICRHEIEQAILGARWGPSAPCCEGKGLVGIADGC